MNTTQLHLIESLAELRKTRDRVSGAIRLLEEALAVSYTIHDAKLRLAEEEGRFQADQDMREVRREH